MSYQPNEEYKENVWDEFQEALDNSDRETCRNIIRATRSVGFDNLADELEELATYDTYADPNMQEWHKARFANEATEEEREAEIRHLKSLGE